MQYLLLLGAVLSISVQDVMRKQYDLKAKTPNVFLFTAFSAMTALVFFAARAGFRLHFVPGLIPYAALFAVTYAGALIGAYLSVRFGSLALSALTNSYSLVIPALYGVFALGEKMSPMGICGIACLCVSLLLVHWPSEKVRLSWKCAASLLLLFFANGVFGTVQKVQQLAYDGGYISEVMVMALGAAAVILLFCAVFSWKHGEKQLRIAALHGLPNGVANGCSNLLIMLLTGMIPNTVLYPTVSAGGIVMGCVVGMLVYKERPTGRQLAGFAMGAAAAVLLNL